MNFPDSNLAVLQFRFLLSVFLACKHFHRSGFLGMRKIFRGVSYLQERLEGTAVYPLQLTASFS
jgi:hypothetical protein